MIQAMSSEYGTPSEETDFVLESARKIIVIDAITDPHTLYPQEINITEKDFVKVQGESSINRVKENNCSFTWAK